MSSVFSNQVWLIITNIFDAIENNGYRLVEQLKKSILSIWRVPLESSINNKLFYSIPLILLNEELDISILGPYKPYKCIKLWRN